MPAIVAILSLAFLVRLLFVLAVPFFVRPDEVFQALEPAHRLLTGYGVMSWEWHERIRSWLLPGLIVALMQAGAWLGLGHSILLVQSVLAILSLAVVAVAIAYGQAVAGRAGALFCGVLTAFWPDTVLYGSHTLTETQGGNLLAIGTMIASMILRRRAMSWTAPLGAGLVLGLAVSVRFQLIPAVVPVLVIAAIVDWRRYGLLILAGLAIPILAQALLDDLTLGSPLQSIWKNLQINIAGGRADAYGTMPRAFYLNRLAKLWGIALLPMSLCVLAGARTALLPAVTALAVIGSHSMIHHKEFSFIYGAIPLVLTVAGCGAARLAHTSPRTLPNLRSERAVAAAMGVVSLLTLLHGYRPILRDKAYFIALARDARNQPGLCGVGLYTASSGWWIWTGGYSLLDRPVPLYLMRTPAELADAAPGFNVLIAGTAILGSLPPGYVTVECSHAVCLLRRTTPCRTTSFPLMQDEADLGLPNRN